MGTKVHLSSWFVAALLLTPGCHSNPTAPAPTKAVVTVTVRPSPIAAATASVPPHQWEATFEFDLREIAGVGASYEGVQYVVRDAASGTEVLRIPRSSAPPSVPIVVGTNRALTVAPGPLRYSLPGGSRRAVLTVTAFVRDAFENQFSVDATTNIE